MAPITYPTELPTSLQGFFDNAWQHGVVEKRPKCYVKKGPGAGCNYRLGDNCCLIGRSIPEAMYSPGMEGDAAEDVIGRIATKPVNGRALDDLQFCHDDTADDETYHAELERKLRLFAANYGLTIPGEAS